MQLKHQELFPEEKEWQKEWKDMPEFISEKEEIFKAIVVKFSTVEDYKEFMKAINQQLTKNTRSIWFPKKEMKSRGEYRYVSENES